MSVDRFLVLAVDDRQSNRVALRAILSRFPEFELMDVASGEEALIAVMEHPVQLLLVDVNMPGMDGFEVAQHLQSIERTRHIPLIFLTATAQSELLVKRGYDLGAVDYLAKPIEDNLLISRLRIYKRLYEQRLRLQASNTALEQALAELREAQSRLLVHEKLAALLPMVSAVAHELNTPLGNCSLMASTLQDRCIALRERWSQGQALRRSELQAFLDAQAEGAALLLHGLGQAAEVVARFKQMSVSDQAWSWAPFDLAELLQVVCSRASRSLFSGDFQVQLHVPAGIVMHSFAGGLSRLVEELLANSALHGFAGRSHGLVQLDVQRLNEDEIEICYSDDGVGMRPEVLAKVFDPFFTTRFGQGSSGLGLSIVYNLVHGLLGGALEVDSSEGAGSRFTIRLPRVAPLAASATAS